MVEYTYGDYPYNGKSIPESLVISGSQIPNKGSGRTKQPWWPPDAHAPDRELLVARRLVVELIRGNELLADGQERQAVLQLCHPTLQAAWVCLPL
jgi:hypothetical protein